MLFYEGDDTVANTTNLNIRVDAELKRQAERVFSELGLSLSSAMNIFLKNSVRYGGIPFEMRLEEPNEITIKAIEDVEAGRNLRGPFNSVEALMENLDA